MKKIVLLLLVSSMSFLITTAQWSNDPSLANTQVFTGPGDQYHSFTVADGSGGAIVVWESSIATNNVIFYNKLNANGVAIWASVTTGLQLSATSRNNIIRQVVSDGNGGAFVCWEDGQPGARLTIVQHISSTGTLLWAPPGITLTTNGHGGPMCSDNNGGIIGTWVDLQYDPVYSFPRSFAQRINSSGNIAWTAGGVRILNTTAFDEVIGAVPDGNGGAIFALLDTRNDNYDPATQDPENLDIYAQRLNSSGVAVWVSTGVPVCTFSNNQMSYFDGKHNYMTSDGANGAIVAWEDYRNDPNNGNNSPYNEDIYAQRINANGAAQWTANGVAVCNATGDQYNVSVIPDGNLGAVIAWGDERTNFDVYSQRINASGAAQWGTNGKVVAVLSNYVDYTASADESGTSMLFAWTDFAPSTTGIFAQKILVTNGSLLWGTGAIECSRAEDRQEPAVTNNGSGGAIISWTDFRNGDADVYANRVLANGTLPVNLMDFSVRLNTSSVTLNWVTSSEYNTKDFQVQRSLDGVSFEIIGTVKAAGNSSAKLSYSFDDFQSMSLKGKVVYFRVAETDIDGRLFYTEIKNVKIEGGKNKITLLYNPVVSEAVLYYECNATDEIQLSVVDHLGRVVTHKQVNVIAGKNKITLEAGNLAKGIYEIQLRSNNNRAALRMMKN